MSKKKWKKPKLIVLVRGNRQERVLLACKSGVSGPGGNWGGCQDTQDPQKPDQCNIACSVEAPS